MNHFIETTKVEVNIKFTAEDIEEVDAKESALPLLGL